MRLIDVLNKIANGELKEGTKLKFEEREYIYENSGCEESYDFYNSNGNTIFEDYFIGAILESELELIEPQGPTECEHEWREWSLGNRFQVTHYRKCDKCGLEEETEYNHFADVGKMAEPTDNTKIEELDADYYEGQPKAYTIVVIINKLNEVIRHINKEDKNE